MYPQRYNNNYTGGGFSFSRGTQSMGYSRNNYGNQYPQRQAKKRSGARFHQKDDKVFVTGWKATRHGLLSFIASPYKNTKRRKSGSGREWENWVVKVTNKNTGQTQLMSGLYDVQRRRVFINDMFLMLSPNGGAGGYTGPIQRKNR